MVLKICMMLATAGLLLAGTVQAENFNPVLGKVGDFVLREADVDRLISYQSPEVQQKLEAAPEQRPGLVRQVLITKAVAAKARKEGFERKPEVKEQLSYLIDDFLAQEYLKKVVIGRVTLSEEELKTYYKEHMSEFLIPETAKVRHIFIEAAHDAGMEARGNARKKVEELLGRLKKGGDFESIARESSEDPESAARGGDIGYISAGKTNSPEFEKAVLSLKTGEISDVIETPFGFHIVRVDERSEKRTVSFEEAREYIRSTLLGQIQQNKASAFLEKLEKESGMEVVGEKASGAAEQEKGEGKQQ